MNNMRQATQAFVENQLNMVLFRLAKQTYAVPIEQVRQIIDMVTINPIPQLNHSVAGMINFHGATVPVVNLRKHLGLPDEALRLHTPIILAMLSGRLIGLLVDDVLDVMAFTEEQMRHPDDLLPDDFGEVPTIKGIIQTRVGMVIMLDLEHLFKPQHANALFAAAEAIQQNVEAQDAEEGGTVARPQQKKGSPQKKMPGSAVAEQAKGSEEKPRKTVKKAVEKKSSTPDKASK